MDPIALFFASLLPGLLLIVGRAILVRVTAPSLAVRAWLLNIAMVALVLGPTFTLGVDFTAGSRQPASLMCGSLSVMAIAVAKALRERRTVNHILEFHDSMQQAQARDNLDKADFHENMMYVKRLEIRGGVADLKPVGLAAWRPGTYAEHARQAR
jgi:hypothetical protein